MNIQINVFWIISYSSTSETRRCSTVAFQFALGYSYVIKNPIAVAAQAGPQPPEHGIVCSNPTGAMRICVGCPSIYGHGDKSCYIHS
jgi:hypothetical protein